MIVTANSVHFPRWVAVIVSRRAAVEMSTISVPARSSSRPAASWLLTCLGMRTRISSDKPWVDASSMIGGTTAIAAANHAVHERTDEVASGAPQLVGGVGGLCRREVLGADVVGVDDRQRSGGAVPVRGVVQPPLAGQRRLPPGLQTRHPRLGREAVGVVQRGETEQGLQLVVGDLVGVDGQVVEPVRPGGIQWDAEPRRQRGPLRLPGDPRAPQLRHRGAQPAQQALVGQRAKPLLGLVGDRSCQVQAQHLHGDPALVHWRGGSLVGRRVGEPVERLMERAASAARSGPDGCPSTVTYCRAKSHSSRTQTWPCWTGRWLSVSLRLCG